MTSKQKLSLRDLVALALVGAGLFASQVAMSSLPNIHPVATVIIAGTLVWSWQMLYAVGVFVLLEGFTYGFGLWWVSYLYIWTLLVALTVWVGERDGRLLWATLAGLYGLCFGALCAIPYLLLGGFKMAFAYWLNGIPFDFLHAGGNFAVTFVLLPPLRRALASFGRGGTH